MEYKGKYIDTSAQNNYTNQLLEQLPTPILDRLLVECETQTKLSESIYLSDVEAEKPGKGVIISIGPGRCHPKSGVFIPTTLQPGQKVVWNNFEGKYFNINHKTYAMLQEMDIQAVLGG